MVADLNAGHADFRDAAFMAIHRVMSEDQRAILLSNDLGAKGLDRIRSDFGGRVINTGISEQNAVSLAAGLAMEDRQTFIYGIAAHISTRAYEQIRLDVVANKLPVCMLAMGGGFSYGNDGLTHLSTHDIGIMRAIPGLTVFNPSDGPSLEGSVARAWRNGGPAYIRIDKERVPALYKEGLDYSAGWSMLRNGNDVCIISTGVLVHRALSVAESLAVEGISVGVIDLYRPLPFPDDAISGAGSVACLVSLEEQGSGGIGTMIGEKLTDRGGDVNFIRLGLPDEIPLGSATRGWAHNRYGLNKVDIENSIRNSFGGS